jgi:hypothetical protein
VSNGIYKNGVIMFHCANWAMEVFQQSLSIAIQEENLQNNPILCELLEQLDQDVVGRGFVSIEITDFFNDSPDRLPLHMFYDLSLKAIKKIKQKDFGEFQQGYFNLLDQFSKKMLG